MIKFYKNSIILITIISVLMSMFFVYIVASQNKKLYTGSSLPGQIGKVLFDSKVVNNLKKKGFLTYGPYVELKNGDYTFEISYSAKNIENATYDIVTNTGKVIKAKGKLEDGSLNIISETVTINNGHKSNKFEVRIWYGGKGELSLHSIKIKKVFSYHDMKQFLKYFLIIFFTLLIIYIMFKYSRIITLFVTLLIFIVFSTFLFDAYKNYYNYKKMTYKNMPLTQDIFLYYLNQSFKSEYGKFTSPALKIDDNIENFYIMVDQKDIRLLDSNLPLSGIENYVDARLKINNQNSHKVKLRYRGGSAWNWKFNRKSIKIKFDNLDSYNMMKTINFSVLYSQDMIIEQITQELAKQFGALAPEVKVVRMFLNAEYIGLYLYIDQIDESFLRKNKLMPGSIYDGDYSLKEKWSNYIGTNGIAKLWYDDAIWDKKGSRNHEQKKNREDIKLLIKAVNRYDDKDFFKFADTYLDDKYYKFMALDIFLGTHHHDYFHNHKIYFDPYKGKYTAISWDVRFWRFNKIKDNSFYPLIQRIALNPVLEYKRDTVLYELLNSTNIELIKKRMLCLKNNIMNSYLADKKKKRIAINAKLFPWKETHNPPQLVVADTGSLENIFQTYSNNIENRIHFLKEMLGDIRVQYSIDKNATADTVKVVISVDGNSPVKIPYKNMMLYPGRNIAEGNALNLDIAGYGKIHLKNVPQFYVFTIKKQDFNESKFNLGVNAITMNSVNFKKVNHINIISTDSIHPWKLPKPKYKTKHFSGIVKVNKKIEFDRYTSVIIKPGTTFIMDANTSIYFYGKVTALGTKENPIRFIAKDPKKPWGLVAVQGKATTGSRFEYVEFENGSVDTHNLIHYTSPFNIHDMDWFEVRHCKIGRNFVGDDSMHIAYAKGIVDSCEFVDARSDGLDIDISDVNITNNIFYNSGNDGLDIMTTTMNASNNVFIDMGDKGISVGEWSDANISDSIFIRTVIGTEVKDKSKVKAQNLVFVDSKEKAINLYNKNKRYDTGGFLTGEYIYLLGNTKVKADKRSSKKITHKFEGVLPKLQKYQWYETIENTPYKKYMDKVEVKYAQ